MSLLSRILSMTLGLGLLLGLTRTMQAATDYHPIAAAKGANGSIFLLTTEQTVLAVNLNQTSGAIVGHFTFALNGNPSDMTYGQVGAQEMLFIGSTSVFRGQVHGVVSAFTTDGHPIRSWNFFGHVVGGLTFDTANQTVYVASEDSAEVYSISPQSSSAPRFVGGLALGAKLGSMAIDVPHQELYISDQAHGDLFSMNLATRSVRTLGRVGAPQALLMEMGGTLLIVADSARGQIVTLSVAGQPSAPHPLTPRRAFRAPAGLAWGEASQLIVADQTAGTVTLLSPTGAVINSLALY